jgi:predicted transposase YdaD
MQLLGDIYAEIGEDEQLKLYDEIVQHKETAMLAQYIREKGVREGEIKGDKKRLISIVRSAHKEGLPLSMISKIVHLDISMVNSILNNEEIDIPLHLLDTNASR